MFVLHLRLPLAVAVPVSIFAIVIVTSQVALNHASSLPSFHQHYFSNGVIQLIIEAYTEEMLRDMEASPNVMLTEDQTTLLRQRMRELYNHIRHHPALYQRHLWVGRNKPEIDPDVSFREQQERQSRGSSKKKRYLNDDAALETGRLRSKSSSIQKRNHGAHFPAEEICKTIRQWEQVNYTHDFYDNEVEVIQDNFQQYVFSYRCARESGPCIGISPLYDSECTERYGWMYMYYRQLDDQYRTPQWGYVAAPHHCACKITPKYIPDS